VIVRLAIEVTWITLLIVELIHASTTRLGNRESRTCLTSSAQQRLARRERGGPRWPNSGTTGSKKPERKQQGQPGEGSGGSFWAKGRSRRSKDSLEAGRRKSEGGGWEPVEPFQLVGRHWGQGETGQFKADRCFIVATRHSNF
jgi:hypothetical protein